MPTSPVVFEQYWVPLGCVAPVLEQASEPPELELEEPELEPDEPELEPDDPEPEPEDPELELDEPELERPPELELAPELEDELPELEPETPELEPDEPELGWLPELELTPEPEPEGIPELDAADADDEPWAELKPAPASFPDPVLSVPGEDEHDASRATTAGRRRRKRALMANLPISGSCGLATVQEDNELDAIQRRTACHTASNSCLIRNLSCQRRSKET